MDISGNILMLNKTYLLSSVENIPLNEYLEIEKKLQKNYFTEIFCFTYNDKLTYSIAIVPKNKKELDYNTNFNEDSRLMIIFELTEQLELIRENYKPFGFLVEKKVSNPQAEFLFLNNLKQYDYIRYE